MMAIFGKCVFEVARLICFTAHGAICGGNLGGRIPHKSSNENSRDDVI